ncbi:MAG: CaiB/BaiF CoA transferase family protein [Dehalococcoidia bacterium]
MSEQLLSRVRVLDLTHYIAGAYCTKLLADYGADVIKVERPGQGDGARRLGPFYRDHAHPEKSGLFLHLNTNKRGITLNLKSSAGVRMFQELVGWADVVVESFRPEVMRGLGLAYEELRRVKPGLLMVSISSFGQKGPYRDFQSEEILGYAMGGMMHSTGLPNRQPLKLGGRVGLYQAGAMAATATVISLYGCRAEGRGDYIDLSIMETQAGSVDRRANALLGYQYNGAPYTRTGPSPFRGHWPCRDGYIDMFFIGPLFRRALEMLDQPELVEDPRFSSPEEWSKPENSEAFQEYFLTWSMEHTRQKIWQRAQEARLPAGPVNSTAEVLTDPHFRARGFWTKVCHPYTGELEYPGSPFSTSSGSWEVRRPAPLLGQHNREVFCGLLGYSGAELAKLRETGVI